MSNLSVGRNDASGLIIESVDSNGHGNGPATSTRIIAGTNISISPTTGIGDVTVNAVAPLVVSDAQIDIVTTNPQTATVQLKDQHGDNWVGAVLAVSWESAAGDPLGASVTAVVPTLTTGKSINGVNPVGPGGTGLYISDANGKFVFSFNSAPACRFNIAVGSWSKAAGINFTDQT
jgi:hypothetical protein